MKIIVTGSNGFLGSRLAKKLGQKYKVTGFNRSVGDGGNFKVVHDFISEHAPDVVIHCAAIGDISTCENNKELAYRSNYMATKNIASACADNNSRLIYISSDQVYNYFTGEPISELTPVAPTNYYGFLKAASERDVQALVPRSHIARIAWQYDSYNPQIDDSRGGLFKLIGDAVATNTPLYCAVNSYQYISYVQDTIDALTKMAEQAVPYGIYNVTQETDKSKKQAFEFAMKSLGIDDETIRRLILPKEDEKPQKLCAKAFNLEMCGYRMHTFEEGIARCIADNK